jgi:signal transduction histidine kinase
LAAALRRLVSDWQARHQIMADVLIHLGDQRLPSAVETALYRIVQETLTNVARHAQASSVSVLVERRGKEAVVVVEDDGVGFDPSGEAGGGKEHHLGILGMRERAELLGGQLTIESAPGMGTSVFVQIPIEAEVIP